MSLRLYKLIEAHSRIDRQLRDEQRRRVPNGLRLIVLKKLKLRAKDLIHRLSRRPASMGPAAAGYPCPEIDWRARCACL